jgi:hypothetical protein
MRFDCTADDGRFDTLLERVKFVLQYCRTRDRAEIEAVVGYDRAASALLRPWLQAAVLAHVFDADDIPAAFVAVHEVTSRTVTLSMVATYQWRRVALSVAKWARRDCIPRLLARGYRRAECRAIEGHEEAGAFLEFLGFQLECRCQEYGRSGETFLQYAWRSKDHVLHAQNPLAAEAGTARGRQRRSVAPASKARRTEGVCLDDSH